MWLSFMYLLKLVKRHFLKKDTSDRRQMNDWAHFYIWNEGVKNHTYAISVHRGFRINISWYSSTSCRDSKYKSTIFVIVPIYKFINNVGLYLSLRIWRQRAAFLSRIFFFPPTLTECVSPLLTKWQLITALRGFLWGSLAQSLHTDLKRALRMHLKKTKKRQAFLSSTAHFFSSLPLRRLALRLAPRREFPLRGGRSFVANECASR